ncbi:hypothetical protein IV203_026534 [Nitzschia inconspicua]|uniref:Uncharacterized protein n=1 Tax=Nitzschia inconspicua TaxID=303405 RepID=A0A9K3LJV1_9STRA|nr:hypothetical protein IV203_026534 [Nitzschia inconspicua]
MSPQFANRRSSELQKRLQRRDISLKPSDFCSSGKRNHLLTAASDKANYNKDNVHHQVLTENHSTNPSPSCKEEGIPKTQKVSQESQENSPELVNTRKEQGVVAFELRKAPATSIVGNSLQRILKTHPATTESSGMRDSYLPVATSTWRGSRSFNERASPHIADAEQEYNRMFNAPSLIEVHRKGPSNDAVTEVSEITTDIRTRSLRGASYAERRMAGKLQRMREQNFSNTLQPSGFRLHGHEEDEELEKSSSYVEGDVGDLKQLMEKVEKAKLHLQQSGPIVRRHGLPYETTDFRAEGDDEYSVDPWDGAIRGTNLHFQFQRRETVDPEDGEVLCVKGPPTPRNRPYPERIHNLIRETISSDGDIVIDATEVCDEDLDGVHVLHDSKDGRIRLSDSKTIGTSVLLGEDIIDAEDPSLVSGNDVVQPTKRDFAEAVLSSRAEPSISVEEHKSLATGDAKASLSDHDLAPKNLVEDSSLHVQVDVRKGDSFQSDIVSTSVAFFKSFAAGINTQLENIQRNGLIPETEMGGMLGVLERDINEASEKIPKESGEFVIDFGEELEKSTCGATEAVLPSTRTLPQSNKDLVMYQAKNVEGMLDSLKASYKKSFSQCGVDQNLIRDNTKAMEDMMSNLRKVYDSNAVVCGGAAQNDVFAAAGMQMDKQGSSIVARRSISLMDDASTRSSSLHSLVKQLQEAKTKQSQGGSIEKSQLKKESVEAVEEMLNKAREACNQKSIKLAKLKKMRTKVMTTRESRTRAPEPQTFIVPINMPKKNSATGSSINSEVVSRGYSKIE